MKVPSCVLWGLTKKNNCFLVKQKGARGDAFSHDPLNLTGMHNASSAGLTNSEAIGLTAVKAKSKSGKQFRRDYVLKINHKSYNKTTKVSKSKDGVAGPSFSSVTIKKDTKSAAKSIQGLTFANDKKKALLLKRLGKLHGATRAFGAVKK